jgi:hypothetical protein
VALDSSCFYRDVSSLRIFQISKKTESVVLLKEYLYKILK